MYTVQGGSLPVRVVWGLWQLVALRCGCLSWSGCWVGLWGLFWYSCGWPHGVLCGEGGGGESVTGLHFPCGERWACDLAGLLRSVWVPGGGVAAWGSFMLIWVAAVGLTAVAAVTAMAVATGCFRCWTWDRPWAATWAAVALLLLPGCLCCCCCCCLDWCGGVVSGGCFCCRGSMLAVAGLPSCGPGACRVISLCSLCFLFYLFFIYICICMCVYMYVYVCMFFL